MEFPTLSTVVSYLALLALVFLFLHRIVMLKSNWIRRKLRMQGIQGPRPSFLYGNLPEMQKIQSKIIKGKASSSHGELIAHDYTSTLFPYLERWRKEYGNIDTTTY